MPTPRMLGVRKPYRQSVEETFDPTQGSTITEEWLSAGDNLGGLAAQYARNSIGYRLKRSPVRSTLVATATRNNAVQEAPLERWELLTNQIMQDIREHPNSVGIGQSGLARVLKDNKRHEDGKSVDTSGYTGAQLALFNLLIRGVTHYPIWQWVIRYTANVSNQYNFFTAANAGVGSIYTTSQLDLPGGRLLSTVESIAAPAADSELIWGWLKTSSQETTAARNRVEVSCELQLANWSVYLYT